MRTRRVEMWAGRILPRSLVVLGAAVAMVCLAAVPSHARNLGEQAGRSPGRHVAGSQSNFTGVGPHTCALAGDGTVQCWGSNLKGQLGDGTTTSRSAPGPVNGLANVTAVGVGSGHSCALRANGTVACWGSNTAGQLGDGSTTDRLTPVTVTGLNDAVHLGIGDQHGCAVRATGAVQCWGAQSDGRLGNGTAALGFQASPVTVAGVVDAIAVGPGQGHTCALRATGQVLCWGANHSGQIGNGVVGSPQLVPVAVTGLTGAVAIMAGFHGNCALRGDGAVLCWGANSDGSGGTDPHVANPIATATVVNGISGAIAISMGTRHTCALRADGTVFCWGGNAIGQLGNGTLDTGFAPHPTPALVPGLTGVVALGAGGAWTCARRVDGTMSCWGRNVEGQLGNGTTTNALAPAVVSGFAGSISARGVVAGTAHACARRADGTAACWGQNDLGQAGDGSTTDALVPVVVHGLSNVGALGEGSGDHTCARRGDGSVACWGDNSVQQTGDRFTGALFNTTPFVVVGVDRVVQVATGAQHTCALRSDGAVFCWGGNADGQLGSGFSDTILGAPFQVPGLTNAVAIGAGAAHTCALLAAGTISCWGKNSSGQLGNGTTTSTLAPVAVSSLTDAVALTLGAHHTCALRAGGGVVCWGLNSRGQLGNGSATNRLLPSKVDLTAVALAAGSEHTCAVVPGGFIVCWGSNGFGQLGDGTNIARPAPTTSVVVGGKKVANVTAITGGAYHTCALRGDGQPLCWGRNDGAQVGDGTNANRLSAVEVPSFRFNVDPVVELGKRGRVVTVTALVSCPVGSHVHVRATLIQGAVVGHGVGVGACADRLERYEITIAAHGKTGFAPGPGEAEAEAVVRERGRIVDTQEWTRSVNVTP